MPSLFHWKTNPRARIGRTADVQSLPVPSVVPTLTEGLSPLFAVRCDENSVDATGRRRDDERVQSMPLLYGRVISHNDPFESADEQTRRQGLARRQTKGVLVVAVVHRSVVDQTKASVTQFGELVREELHPQ